MLAKEPKALIYRRDEAETLMLGELIVTILASGEETEGACSLMEFSIPPPPAGTGLHLHKGEHEMGYVLEGTFQFTIGEQTGTITTGSFAFVPKGTPHEFSNLGPGPARVLGLFSPSGFEGFFKEMAHVLTLSSGPPDTSVIASLQQKYNLYMLDTGEQMR
ncbi:MAG TPA: cupin domain-containing protein [Ktedonobacteraceae bacterium]